MYQTTLPPEQAIGHILRHNLSDAAGRKALAKGHRLVANDLATLLRLDLTAVPVAVLEPGDVHENEAAQRLAASVGGAGITWSKPAGGRVNLLAQTDGVAQIDVDALFAVNQHNGLTIATVLNHALVQAGKRIATIKIIPFAVPEQALVEAEQAAHRVGGAIVALRPLQALRVGVIMVGSATARERIERTVLPAVVRRVEDRGSIVAESRYVPPDEQAVAGAVGEQQTAGMQLVIIVGETSIMDADDVTPRGIRRAGGRIEHYGAPVEPGNLLLLAYLERAGAAPLPVLGAPGCVRSRDTNIVDLLLPRLLAGEHITRQDVIALGHGGLL